MANLLTTSKGLWQRSWRKKEPPSPFDDPAMIEKHLPGQPITIAVIGCGQRGKVSNECIICGLSSCSLSTSRTQSTLSNPRKAARLSRLQNRARKLRNTLPPSTLSTAPSSFKHGGICMLHLRRLLLLSGGASLTLSSLPYRIICISRSPSRLPSKGTTSSARSPWQPA